MAISQKTPSYQSLEISLKITDPNIPGANELTESMVTEPALDELLHYYKTIGCN